jgi:hypothetical protein
LAFLRHDLRVALVIALVSSGIYVAVTGPRLSGPTADNHYAHLAASFLAGQLDVIGGQPPGSNDWACFDTDTHAICNGVGFTRVRGNEHWYISFPPFPALVLLPLVAIWGVGIPDALVWAIVAGLAPAAIYLLLRRLRALRRSEREPVEDLLLTALFGLGSVFFFVAVQGTVWFAAQVCACVLLPLYLLAALGGAHPVWAGLALGALFLCRPTTAPFGIFFVVEALQAARVAGAATVPSARTTGAVGRLAAFLSGIDRRRAAKLFGLFAVPIVLAVGTAMWMNEARFESPFEFGHRYLMIRWRGRIETWGLFSYHYLSRNLAVFFGSVPWISRFGYLTISRHGLALWVTTPALVLALFPKRKLDPGMRALAIATALVCVWNLLYQNSGWVQFGYRFSLDYMAGLVVLLAVGGRRVTGAGFLLALVLSIAVNLFGAITFDRSTAFYDDDSSQDRYFQPD